MGFGAAPSAFPPTGPVSSRCSSCPAKRVDLEEPRTSGVMARILALGDDEVERSLDDVEARFGHRHRALIDTFRQHTDELADRLDPKASSPRAVLLGATFTSEYALEGAAL